MSEPMQVGLVISGLSAMVLMFAIHMDVTGRMLRPLSTRLAYGAYAGIWAGIMVWLIGEML